MLCVRKAQKVLLDNIYTFISALEVHISFPNDQTCGLALIITNTYSDEVKNCSPFLSLSNDPDSTHFHKCPQKCDHFSTPHNTLSGTNNSTIASDIKFVPTFRIPTSYNLPQSLPVFWLKHPLAYTPQVVSVVSGFSPPQSIAPPPHEA